MIIAAFVVSNVTQVARAVFGAPTPVNSACARAMSDEIQAIDSILPTIAAHNDADSAREIWSSMLQKQSSHTACTNPDAIAALERFEQVAWGSARRQNGELRPVRESATSFIKAPQ